MLRNKFYSKSAKLILENHEVLKNLNKGKTIPHPWIGRLSIVKAILPKLTYKFNMIPTKIPSDFFRE